MGEWIWSSIKVGGKATREVWEELIELVADDIDNGVEDGCLDLDEVVASKGCIEASGETNYGGGGRVPEFCQANGLTYVLTSDWKYEHAACVQTWQPGWEKPVYREIDSASDPIIGLSALRSALKAGKSLADIVAEVSVGEVEMPPVEIVEEENADA